MRFAKIALVVCLMGGGWANASPFLVSDPLAAGVTSCGIFLDSKPKVEVPVGTDGSGNPICKYDLAGLAVGNHAASATAILVDPTYGKLESVRSAVYHFTKTAPPAAPQNLTTTP